MVIIDSIFPSLTGNLVIGNYPHRMTREDATRLTREDRPPFMVIEMDGPEMQIIVGCYSFAGARGHHGANRWVVFPPNYKGDSSMIYESEAIPMYWDR